MGFQKISSNMYVKRIRNVLFLDTLACIRVFLIIFKKMSVRAGML